MAKDDLALWHYRQPISRERFARLAYLLFHDVPTENWGPAFMRAFANPDRLAEILALILDHPVVWVERFYSFGGAMQATTEFLTQTDFNREYAKIQTDTKALSILRGDLSWRNK